MFAELLKHPRALVLSLVFHLGVIALMVLNLTFSDRPEHIKAGAVVKTVQAEMIDLNQIEEQKKQKQLNVLQNLGETIHSGHIQMNSTHKQSQRPKG